MIGGRRWAEERSDRVEATLSRRTMSVSVPGDLVCAVDEWAAEAQMTRSALVSQILDAERRRRFEIQLEQDYRDAVADGFYDDIEFYFPAQAEVALRNEY